MASADFSQQLLAVLLNNLHPHVRETSRGKTSNLHSMYRHHLHILIPFSLWDFILFSRLIHNMCLIMFVFLRSEICRRLPSDSTSRWTPLPWANGWQLIAPITDFHRQIYSPCTAHQITGRTSLQRFGRFFIKNNAKGKCFEGEKEIKSSTDSYNKEFQKKLWESSILSTLLLIRSTLYQFHSELPHLSLLLLTSCHSLLAPHLSFRPNNLQLMFCLHWKIIGVYLGVGWLFIGLGPNQGPTNPQPRPNQNPIIKEGYQKNNRTDLVWLVNPVNRRSLRSVD